MQPINTTRFTLSTCEKTVAVVGALLVLSGIFLLLASFRVLPPGVNALSSWMPAKILSGLPAVAGLALMIGAFVRRSRENTPSLPRQEREERERQIRAQLEGIFDGYPDFNKTFIDLVAPLAAERNITSFAYEKVLVVDITKNKSTNLFEPDGRCSGFAFSREFQKATNKSQFLKDHPRLLILFPTDDFGKQLLLSGVVENPKLRDWIETQPAFKELTDAGLVVKIVSQKQAFDPQFLLDFLSKEAANE